MDKLTRNCLETLEIKWYTYNDTVLRVLGLHLTLNAKVGYDDYKKHQNMIDNLSHRCIKITNVVNLLLRLQFYITIIKWQNKIAVL